MCCSKFCFDGPAQHQLNTEPLRIDSRPNGFLLRGLQVRILLGSPLVKQKGRSKERPICWVITKLVGVLPTAGSKTEPKARAAAVIAVPRTRVPWSSIIVIAAVAVVVVSVDITRTGAPAAPELIAHETNLLGVGGFRCSYCCRVQRGRRSSGGQERGGSHNGKDCLHTKLPSG